MLESSRGRDLLGHLHGLTLAALPVDVIARARDCLLDALGCGAFGAEQPWSRILCEEMLAEAPRGEGTVIGQASSLAAPAAALCNGTAIHGFELDDLIADSIVHPGAAVVPAALAAAEAANTSGEGLVLAIVAGYEAMHRVGVALGDEPARRGFHKTSLAAPVAAAVSACIASGLSRDELLSAVGLSCSAASGVKNFAAGHGGGMVKRLHLGRAAEAGVRAAQLVRRGFQGPPEAIDGAMGLIEVFGGDGAKPDRLTRGLGEEWALNEVWFKVYPICGWIQSVVQILQQLRGESALRGDQVRTVRVGVSSYAARNNGEKAPLDTMGAQYSIPYCAALALLGDPRDPAEFRAERVADSALRDLASRVEVVVDPEVEAVYPAKFGASVELMLHDGEPLRRTVLECYGTPADPCTADELLAKFTLLARKRFDEQRVRNIAERVKAVEKLRSVRELSTLLRGRA